MINIKRLIPLLFLTHLCQGYEPKEGSVNASFGPYFFKTHFDSSKTTLDDRFNGGTAIIITGDISKKGALEIALFNYQKTYFRENGNQLVATRTGTVQVTMGYRWWLHPNYSTSMGFYSAYSFGRANTLFNDQPSMETLKTSADDTTEYGIDLAAQAELGSVGPATLNLDLRYSYSLTNKTHESGNHYGAFLGLRFPIKDK